MKPHLANINELPSYLRPYIVMQDASLYTPIDHASWRFILRISQIFFSKHAHQKYLDGLSETGISTESIPLIDDMNACLKKFNWQAVAVSGFIPPAVFMEFMSLGILPIACDMRQIGHLAYTPAPDIVHEAAGHAPIIADPNYAAYLRSYGEISQKAIFSSQDMEVYQAIRNLSDVKEDPKSTPEDIEKAQHRLDHAVSGVTFVSEATQLARMAWWTIEYGLIGDLENPKIYGAGLLSSIGESYHCFDPEVKKVPFSLDCIKMSYDITRPQPQLYVTPSFEALTEAIEELASQMAFRQGGVIGLDKAKQAQVPTTTVFDSGIQISGILKNWVPDSSGTPCYLQFQGPTQLSFQSQEIEGQGATYHQGGFSTPLGKVSRLGKGLDQLQEEDLVALGFLPGKKSVLQLDSGVQVEGILEYLLRKNNKTILIGFKDCKVTRGSEVYFQPEWGMFDMACGQKVVSVFGGAADQEKYLNATGGFHQDPGKQKSNLTEENKDLNQLYAQVRKIRDLGKLEDKQKSQLSQIHQELENKFKKDWLLRWEILELALKNNFKPDWISQIHSRLNEISEVSSENKEVIQRGLAALKSSV